MASGLPIGVRFRPTKVQLVTYFLATRLKDGALPPRYPQFIDYDIYSDHPFNILASTMERRGATDVDEGFFFCRLNTTTPNGKRITRSIKDHGTWSEKSKTHEVCIGQNIVGVEKYFKFTPKAGSNNKNRDEWTMHEYYNLDENNEIVLCHITKKPDSSDAADERCRGTKRSQTTYAKIMPLDHEGSTSKRGRIEYDQPAGCSSGIINPIQDYVSQVVPQGYNNSALETTNKDALTEEIEAMMLDSDDKYENNTDNNQEVFDDPQAVQLLEDAEKTLPLPNGAQEDGDQFDIDEFVRGLSLPNGAEDNTSNSLESPWTDFGFNNTIEFEESMNVYFSSLPPLPTGFLV